MTIDEKDLSPMGIDGGPQVKFEVLIDRRALELGSDNLEEVLAVLKTAFELVAPLNSRSNIASVHQSGGFGGAMSAEASGFIDAVVAAAQASPDNIKRTDAELAAILNRCARDDYRAFVTVRKVEDPKEPQLC